VKSIPGVVACIAFLSAAATPGQAASTSQPTGADSFIVRTAQGARSRATESSVETYPNKPVRLIVPFAPGATNDILARMVAAHLNQTWGHPFIVDNRTGAEGIIGTETAVKARPDGYTLVIISSAYTMNPAVMKLPYDPLTALTFVAKIGKSFLVLAVGPALQVTSVKELIAAARAKPGQIVLSSSGGFLHFASALFVSLSKEKFNIVLYKGGYPAMMDIIGGQTHAGFQASVAVLPHLRSGRLKGLAVGNLTRVEMLPDLPTLDESGIKGYECANWYAIGTAFATPRPIVTKLHDEIARYFTLPETLKQMSAMGASVELRTAEEMRKIIPLEIEKWTKVAVDAGMPRVDK
jgi:tripartite-type tricarboxylate transporter receptor subunit TctC